MIAYKLELYKLVYPKWAAAMIEISPKGKLTFVISPSKTPGTLPAGFKGGSIAKGTKVFDYEKELAVSLSLAECLQILDFIKAQNAVQTVEFIHMYKGTSSKFSMAWSTGKSTKVEVCNININRTEGEEKKKVFIPIPFNGMREIAVILDSYIKNYAVIKLICQANLLTGVSPFSQTSSSKSGGKKTEKAFVDPNTLPDIDDIFEPTIVDSADEIDEDVHVVNEDMDDLDI